jgi:transposase
MPKYSAINITESLMDLKKLRKKLNGHRSKNRIQSLIYTKENRFKTRKELATHLGVGLASLNRWSKTYLESGLDAVLDINSGGHKPSLLSQEIHDALKEKVFNSLDPFRGYNDAVLWVNSTFNKSFKYPHIRKYLITHFKTKLKTPRKSHYKKDEEAIEAFKKTTGYLQGN